MTSSKDMKVVITGASGLLGRALMVTFQQEGSWKSILGTAFSRSGDRLRKVDLSDLSQIAEFIQSEKPDFLVHAAAQRFPDKVEADPEAAQKLNVQATEQLATCLAEYGGRMVYISTDYVFDGEAPPYSEDAQPNPLNTYGKMKLDGEKATLNVNKNNIVLRIPVLYGNVQYLGESAVTVLLSNLLTEDKTKKITVSDYELRRPSHVEDIARVVQDLLMKKIQDPTEVEGIYQWCGSEPLTKYGMLLSMASAFNLDVSHIVGDNQKPTSGTKRPRDVTMKRTRLEKLGISHHTDFKTGVKDALQEWVDKN